MGVKVGVGARHALFPNRRRWAPPWAAGSPTLFSTASGVFGLAAGPSGLFRCPESRVRPLSPLGSAVAPPGCGPGPDTPVSSIRVWAVGTGSAPTCGGALARWDGSDLLPLRLPSPHRPAVPHGIAGVVEVSPFALGPRLAWPLPRLSRLSASFAGRNGVETSFAPGSVAPCWLAVAAVHPLGDCD